MVYAAARRIGRDRRLTSSKDEMTLRIPPITSMMTIIIAAQIVISIARSAGWDLCLTRASN